jgi:formyl-CoA transferase
VRERQGNQVPATVSCGLFQASDDVWIVLSTSTDKTLNRLAELMGRPDMITDPCYATNRDRVANRDAVNGIATDWFGGRTGEELQEACDAAGVPASRVNTIADVFADPHVQQRQSLIEVEHPHLGTLTMPAVVPRFSNTPGEVRTAGPAPGQHTHEVLSGLGLSEDELGRLAEAGEI